MQTLYIDIYFLINFTVDLLSIHMAVLFTKLKASQGGMIISALIGALYAVALVFMPKNKVLFVIGTLLYFFAVAVIIARGCRISRKVKFIAAFLFMEILIGGTVYFVYGVLNRIISQESLEEMKNERNLVVFSLVILLSIGVLKILLSLFRNNVSETKARVKLILFDDEYYFDALIDSGNFLKDPMDLSPVMLINPKLSKKIFPYGAPDISETDNISEKMRKRIRVIPISFISGKKVLCGFKADGVLVENNGKYEPINVTIAFDKEEGSFAGFDALLPYSALENI